MTGSKTSNQSWNEPLSRTTWPRSLSGRISLEHNRHGLPWVAGLRILKRDSLDFPDWEKK